MIIRGSSIFTDQMLSTMGFPVNYRFMYRGRGFENCKCRESIFRGRSVERELRFENEAEINYNVSLEELEREFL